MRYPEPGSEPTEDDFVFPNAKGQSWRPKAASQLREDLAAARIPTRYGEHPLTGNCRFNLTLRKAL